jgi:hypothetical protein
MEDTKVKLLEDVITRSLITGEFQKFVNDLKQLEITSKEAKGMDPFGEPEIGTMVAAVLDAIDKGNGAEDSLKELYKYVKQAEKLFSSIGLGEYNMSDAKDMIKVNLGGDAKDASGPQNDYLYKVDPRGQNPDISKSLSDLAKKVDLIDKKFSDIITPVDENGMNGEIEGTGPDSTEIYGPSDEVIEEGVVTPEPVGDFNHSEANFGNPISRGIKAWKAGGAGKDKTLDRKIGIGTGVHAGADRIANNLTKDIGKDPSTAGAFSKEINKALAREMKNSLGGSKADIKDMKNKMKLDKYRMKRIGTNIDTVTNLIDRNIYILPKVAAAAGEITREFKGQADIPASDARAMLEDIVSNKALTQADANRAIDQYAAKARSMGATIPASMINDAKSKLAKDFSSFTAEDLGYGDVINAYKDNNFSELLVVGASFSQDEENAIVKAIVLSSEGYDNAGDQITFSVSRDTVFSVSDNFDFNTGCFFSEAYGDDMNYTYFDDEQEIVAPTDELTELPDETTLENAAGDPETVIDGDDHEDDVNCSEADGRKVLIISDPVKGTVVKEGPLAKDAAVRKADSLRQQGLQVTLADPTEAPALVAKKKMSLAKKVAIGVGVGAAAVGGAYAADRFLNGGKGLAAIKSHLPGAKTAKAGAGPLARKEAGSYKESEKGVWAHQHKAAEFEGERLEKSQARDLKHLEGNREQRINKFKADYKKAYTKDERYAIAKAYDKFRNEGDPSVAKLLGESLGNIKIGFSESDGWYVVGKITSGNFSEPIVIKEGPFFSEEEAHEVKDELMKEHDGCKRDIDVVDHEPTGIDSEKPATDLEVGDVTTIGTEGVKSEVVIKDKETDEDGNEIIKAEVLSSEAFEIGTELVFSVDENALFSVYDIYSEANSLCFSEIAFSGDKVYFISAGKGDKAKKIGPLTADKADAKMAELKADGWEVNKFADEVAAEKATNKKRALIATGVALGVAALGTAAYLNKDKISKALSGFGKKNLSHTKGTTPSTLNQTDSKGAYLLAGKDVAQIEKQRDELKLRLSNAETKQAKAELQAALGETNKFLQEAKKRVKDIGSAIHTRDMKEMYNYKNHSEVEALDLEVGDVTTIAHDGDQSQIVVTDLDTVGDEEIVKGTVLDTDSTEFSVGDEIEFSVSIDTTFSLEDHYFSELDLFFSECDFDDEDKEGEPAEKPAMDLEVGDVTTISDDDSEPVKVEVKDVDPQDDGTIKIEGIVVDTEHSQFSYGDIISFSVDFDTNFSVEDSYFNIDVTPTTEPVVTVVERTVTAPADSEAAAQAVAGDNAQAALPAPADVTDVGPGDPNLKDGETVMASAVTAAEKALIESSTTNFSQGNKGEMSFADKMAWLKSE